MSDFRGSTDAGVNYSWIFFTVRGGSYKDCVSRVTYREPNYHQAAWIAISNAVRYLRLVLIVAWIWEAKRQAGNYLGPNSLCSNGATAICKSDLHVFCKVFWCPAWAESHPSESATWLEHQSWLLGGQRPYYRSLSIYSVTQHFPIFLSSPAFLTLLNHLLFQVFICVIIF